MATQSNGNGNGFTFADAEVPVLTRGGQPNPFLDVVKGLKGTGKAKSFTVEANSTEAKNVKTISRQLREAGKPNDVTVRQSRQAVHGDPKNKGKVTGVTFTFWTTDRIVHADSSENGN